jgi:hypothetical protein
MGDDLRLSREVPLWAALRCHPSQTIDLVDRLTQYGLTGWTPRIRVRRRLPRKKKAEVRIAPLLPSYAFVQFEAADQAVDLGLAGKAPNAWPFLFNGTRPVLPVVQLTQLELAATMRPDALDRFGSYRPGQLVAVIYGPLHGRAGTIVSRKGRDRWVVEVEGTRVSVPSFLLQSLGHISSAG